MKVIKRKATHLRKFAKKRELALGKIQKLRRAEKNLEKINKEQELAKNELSKLKNEISSLRHDMRLIKKKGKYWESRYQEIREDRVELNKLIDKGHTLVRQVKYYKRQVVIPAFVPCYLVGGKMKVGQHYKTRTEAESAIEEMGHQYIGAYPVVADLFNRDDLIHALKEVDKYADKIQIHCSTAERYEF